MHIQQSFNIIEYLKDEENNKEDEDNIEVLPEVEGYF